MFYSFYTFMQFIFSCAYSLPCHLFQLKLWVVVFYLLSTSEENLISCNVGEGEEIYGCSHLWPVMCRAFYRLAG